MTYQHAAQTITRYRDKGAARVRFQRESHPDVVAYPDKDLIEFEAGCFTIKKADGTTHIFPYYELTALLDY